MSLEDILDSSIVVCAGSGGVGKTTVSAAIALEAACRGRRTIVVTIDPARRLANAMGLEGLSNEPSTISPEQFKRSGMEPMPLKAMMLDTKTTFDDLVYRYARDAKRATAIINNRFYQAISSSLSGTHEYMAMEKLYEIHASGEFDLIVIDTPPTRNALDFLEAPKRMTSFLEGRLLKWFLLPAIGGGKGLFKVANFAAVSFLKALNKIVGAEVLKDTAEFFSAFEGMYEGFKQRAQSVYELLRQPTTAFVVVTAPSEAAIDEAVFFASTLRDYKLPFGALVVNRVHPSFDVPDPEGAAPGTINDLLLLARDLNLVAEAEEANLKRLEKEIPIAKWAKIPYLTTEVTNLAALGEIADLIFGAGEQKPAKKRPL